MIALLLFVGVVAYGVTVLLAMPVLGVVAFILGYVVAALIVVPVAVYCVLHRRRW